MRPLVLAAVQRAVQSQQQVTVGHLLQGVDMITCGHGGLGGRIAAAGEDRRAEQEADHAAAHA